MRHFNRPGLAFWLLILMLVGVMNGNLYIILTSLAD